MFAASTSISIVTPSIQHLEANCTLNQKNIQRNKAPGPGGVSAHSLAIVGPSAAAALSTVFKFCSANNCFPTSWKKAKMNAIFKKAVKLKFLITGPYHFYLFPASFLTAECVILQCRSKGNISWGGGTRARAAGGVWGHGPPENFEI